MGKRTKSPRVLRFKDAPLLHRFVASFDGGDFVSKASGPILEQMRTALARIIDGDDPREALGIRTKGTAPDPHRFALAQFIHEHVRNRETWAVIEHYAAEWLTERGRPVVKEKALMAAYNAFEGALRLFDDIAELPAGSANAPPFRDHDVAECWFGDA